MAKILWTNDFSGSVNQATAPHLLATNQLKFMNNITQSEVGAIGHRRGSERFLEEESGDTSCQGLHMYQKPDGTNYLHAVFGGDLFVADEANERWDRQDGGIFGTTENVDMVNFLGKHYMIGANPESFLRVATESGDVPIVNPGDGGVAGAYLAVNGSYLMVADPDAGVARWSGVGTDTFDANDFVNVPGRIRGVASFGSGRPFVVFTERSYVIVDPVNQTTDEVNVGIGAVSHRSIKNVRGYLIFLSREGFYSLGLNDAYPQEISRMIRNEWDADAIFNRISGTSFRRAAAASLDDRYFCAVRSLTTPVQGEQLDRVIIEFDLASQTVKTHTYQLSEIANVMAEYINDNEELHVYAGSITREAVYKLFVEDKWQDQTFQAIDVDVDATAITKDYAFYDKKTGVVEEQQVMNIHFRYTSDSELTVQVSLDGGAFEDFVTLPATDQAKIWEWNDSTFGQYCKNISLKIVGSGKWMLYGLGFEIESTDTTAISLS